MQSFARFLLPACLVCVGHVWQALAQPSHQTKKADADPQKVLHTLLLSLNPGAWFGFKRPKPEPPSELKRSLPSADDTLQMALMSDIVYNCPHHGGIPLELLRGKPVASLIQMMEAAHPDLHEPVCDDCDEVEQKLKEAKKRIIELVKELELRSPKGVFEWFEETPTYDTEVALVRSPMNKRITVVYRGTSELTDWSNNLQLVKVPLERGVWVHHGWRGCYLGDGLEKRVFRDVEKLLLKYPDHEVYVTGHSLGGAMSMLFGVRFAQSHPDVVVKVINFGAPRVGDSGWRNLFMSLPNLAVTRVINRNDVVPRGPMFGYKHIGHSIFVDGDQSNAYKPVVYPWKSDGGPMNLLMSHSVPDHSMIGDTGYLSAIRMATTDETKWVPSSIDDL